MELREKKLELGSSIEDLEEFLLYHMDEADDRKLKTNRSLTKKNVWDINMGVVISRKMTKVENIVIKNVVREFGSYYEGI